MSAESFRITPRFVVGLGILTIGLLGTLDNLGMLDADRLLDWWPLIVIAVGVVKLLDPRSGRFAAIAFIVVGAALLIDSLDFMNFDVSDLIPIGIAVVGGKLVLDALGRRPSPPRSFDERDSVVHTFAIMSGVRRQSTSLEFRGGDASAVMGGVELDLRNASIKDGEEPVLDVFALWGGVEITVPEHWRVVGSVMPVMGGFEDKSTNRTGTGPVLVIRGTAIMGAVEVKN